MGTASVSEFLMTALIWFSMAVFSSSWFSLICKKFLQSLHVVRALPQDTAVQSFHQSH